MTEWERLQELLLNHERERLDQLEDQQLSEQRQQRLRSDLPQTLDQLRGDPDLRASLSSPVTAALHESIERDRESVASLLFPVMGPAIRRAVQESLRSAVQRINLALEHGLSPRAWRWRLESWRSGEPFAQIVLRHSLSFSVNELFLIHRNTGLMIARRSRREVLALDQDAVASMLTAIQNFLRQSLTEIAEDPLRTVEMGGASLWLINGPDAILAAVIEGEPPLALREGMHESLEAIHSLLRDELKQYQGNKIQHSQVDALLDQHLVEQRPASPNRGPARLAWGLGIAAALVLLSIWTWHHWQLKQDQQQLQNFVDETPGLMLFDSRIQQGQISGTLLRDPLAPDQAAILKALAFEPNLLQLKEQSYLSQEPELLLQRLERVVPMEPKASLRVENQQLLVDGQLTWPQWQQLAQSQALLAPQWRLSKPQVDLDSLRRDLAVPDTVSMSQQDTELIFTGQASQQWHNKLPQLIAKHSVYYTTDTTELAVLEQQQLSHIIESLNGSRLNFNRGTEFDSASQQRIHVIAEQIQQLEQLAATTGQSIQVQLLGMSDGVDSWDVNLALRRARASASLEALIAAGVNADTLHADAQLERPPPGFNAALRYCELMVTIRE